MTLYRTIATLLLVLALTGAACGTGDGRDVESGQPGPTVSDQTAPSATDTPTSTPASSTAAAPTPTPAPLPPQAVALSDLGRIEELRDMFNADDGAPRLLMLMSPT